METYVKKISGIGCDKCKQVYYIQLGSYKAPFPTLVFCPVCGTEGEQCNTLSEAYYLSLSYKYGLPPDSMEKLNKTFMHQLTSPNAFRTFDKFMKTLFDRLGVQ